MSDHALAVRKAVVAKLRATPALTALVPAASIYGEEAPAMPAWPFIRYQLPTLEQYENSCGDGAGQEVTLHVFARGPGMDACTGICVAIHDALLDDVLAVEPLGLVSLDYRLTRLLHDQDEAGAYHGLVRYEVVTVEG